MVGTFDAEVERLDSIASWTRHTLADSDANTMNAASMYGNGLVRVMIDGQHLELLAARMPARLAGQLVASFVDETDAYLDVVVEGEK